MENHDKCCDKCCLWPSLGHQEMFCNKRKMLLSCLYLHLSQCAKLLSKHHEGNFTHLLGMGLVTDVVFLVLSSANNELIIYVFAAGVGCEIRYVGTTELKNTPYPGVPVQSTLVSKKHRCSD